MPSDNFRQNILPPKPSPDKTLSKAIIIALVLLLAIVGFFLAKKSYQANQKKTLQEKIIAQSKQKIENIEAETVTPEQVNKYIFQENVQLIDIREEKEFAIKHIESSVNLPLSQINDQIGLIRQDFLVVIIDRQDSPQGKILTQHLASEGVNAKYLAGGILAYAQAGYDFINIGNPTSTKDLIKVKSISAKEIKEKLLSGEKIAFVDVRPRLEYSTDRIDGSLNIPLEDLEASRKKLPIGWLLVFDREQIRSFRAAVRLYDMNILTAYNCLDDYATLKKVLFEEETPETKPLETTPTQ